PPPTNVILNVSPHPAIALPPPPRPHTPCCRQALSSLSQHKCHDAELHDQKELRKSFTVPFPLLTASPLRPSGTVTRRVAATTMVVNYDIV
ncbi:hypothetical protein PIB30_094604, partial [Stylosanthes scabra]|nr:hypothetical protein [Stylosanthes scabra]